MAVSTGNPFYVDPMGDRSQAMGAFGQSMVQAQGQVEDRQSRQKAEQRFNEAKAAMMAAQQSGDPAAFDAVLAQYPEFQQMAGAVQQATQRSRIERVRGEVVGADTQRGRMSGALNPQQAQKERNLLTSMGIDTPKKKESAREFSRRVRSADDAEIPGLVQERIEEIVGDGGSAVDTAQLQQMSPQEVKQTVEQFDIIQDREAWRELYTIDPEGAMQLLEDSEMDGIDLTAKMKEYQYLQSLPEGTKAEKAAKDEAKRMFGATSRRMTADEKIAIEKGKSKIRVKELEEKQDIKLSTQPEIERQISEARKEGTFKAEDVKSYEDIQAALPALREVVTNLKALGRFATYTKAGKAFNVMAKEAGFKPSRGATDRAKYIAVVDNEILPLLKSTFGAAFTAEEGKSLKITLGDPDSGPEEKDAQLDAFIEAKIRQSETMGRKLGIEQTTPPAENADADLFKKYGI